MQGLLGYTACLQSKMTDKQKREIDTRKYKATSMQVIEKKQNYWSRLLFSSEL